MHVGVDPRRVLPIARQPRDHQIEQVLLVPHLARGAQLQMARIPGFGDLEGAFAESAFHRVQIDAAIAHVLGEVAVEPIARLKAYGIADAGNNVKFHGKVPREKCPGVVARM